MIQIFFSSSTQRASQGFDLPDPDFDPGTLGIPDQLAFDLEHIVGRSKNFFLSVNMCLLPQKSTLDQFYVCQISLFLHLYQEVEKCQPLLRRTPFFPHKKKERLMHISQILSSIKRIVCSQSARLIHSLKLLRPCSDTPRSYNPIHISLLFFFLLKSKADCDLRCKTKSTLSSLPLIS